MASASAAIFDEFMASWNRMREKKATHAGAVNMRMMAMAPPLF